AADHSGTLSRNHAHLGARDVRVVSEKTGSDCVVGVRSKRLSTNVARFLLCTGGCVWIVAGPGTRHARHQLKAGRTARADSRWRSARDHSHWTAVARVN